jgi:hypothetical protein
MVPEAAQVVPRLFFVVTGTSILLLWTLSPTWYFQRSMGGLLAADSLHAFIHSRSDVNAPLWPNIIACLAFDTPVYHPFSVLNESNEVFVVSRP